MMRLYNRSCVVLLLALSLTGCRWIVMPGAFVAENKKSIQAGRAFEQPVKKRPLPDLSHGPTLAKTLAYAYGANGDFEAAYRDWRAALARVPQAGALEDPSLEFGVLFATDNVKGFDDAFDEITAGLTQEFPAPGKRAKRAEQSLSEAQATGERFRSAKYDLQSRVTAVFAQIWLNRSLADLVAENVRLLREGNELALARFEFMAEEASLGDLQKFEVELLRTESELRELQIERKGLVAQLNALLNRPVDAPFGRPQYPSLKSPAMSDAQLFQRAIERNPDLAAMRREIEALGAAEALARLERRPDFMLSTMGEFLPMTDVLMPGIGVGMTLPLNRERIRAQITEAISNRRAAEERYRSSTHDTLGRLVMALVGLRNAARVEEDYGSRIVPVSEELLQTQLDTYGSGGGDILGILDSERLLIDFRRILLQARADRLRYLAELEEILAEDLYR